MPLAPLSGLLEESLEHAARAWERRVSVAINQKLNLRALVVMDDAVDRAVMSTRFYGERAKNFLEQKIESCDPQDRDAWVFLRLVHSLQVKSPDALSLAESLVPDSPHIVRDAYWHYPIPTSMWLATTDHALPLLKSHSPALLGLGIEVVGRIDARAARTTLYGYVDSNQHSLAALLALARQGHEHPQHGSAVNDALKSADVERRTWGLLVAVTLGRIEWLKPYETLVERVDPISPLAWCAWSCLQPRRAADAVLANVDVPFQVRLHVAAITGYIDLLIPLLASIANDEKEADAFECDLIYLVLRHLPMEVSVLPQDRASKSRALRSQLLSVLRNSHVTLQNNAHDNVSNTAWKIEAIVQDPNSYRDVRIREGERLRPGVQDFPACISDLTHPLRDWIYRERALISQKPLSLCSQDISRRQIEAAMLAKMAADADAAPAYE
jgi:hypothetical protein